VLFRVVSRALIVLNPKNTIARSHITWLVPVGYLILAIYSTLHLRALTHGYSSHYIHPKLIIFIFAKFIRKYRLRKRKIN
jgi:hypothetical protein